MSRRRVRAPQVLPCLDCGGTGYMDKDRLEPCEPCNATGVEPDRNAR